MFKYYLKIAIRNLIKNKSFSVINTFGMTVGITSFILIGIYVFEETQHDKYYTDKERTYRIFNKRINENNESTFKATTPPTLGPTLANEFPEVESALRIMDVKQDLLVSVDGEGDYYGGAFYAENSIFNILDVTLTKGSSKDALVDPNTVIISESLALKLFKGKEALGEIIDINQRPFEVAGVYKQFPSESHLEPTLILSFSSFTQYMPDERMNDWTWDLFYTYVKFHKPVNQTGFEGKLTNLVNRHLSEVGNPGIAYNAYIQNISSIYLNSNHLEQDIAKKGNVVSLYALSASALFILVIVCINFINLTTTQAMSRMKEVGIKKVIGASFTQIVVQITLEAILLSLSSALIAGVIINILIEPLGDILDKSLSFNFFNGPFNVISLILFGLLLGLISGLYPAVKASRFKAINILNKKGNSNKGSLVYRNSMVIIQFFLSATLVIASIVVYQQIDYLRNTNLGFEKDHILTIPLKPGLRKNLETTKQLFLSEPSIKSATYSYGLPGDAVPTGSVVQPGKMNEVPTNLFFIDPDYVQTLGLQLIAGRDFDPERISDFSEAFLINERAVHALGFSTAEEAIGQPLSWEMWHYDSTKRGEIIGVVKDFHFTSLREEISPAVLHYYPRSLHKMALKVSSKDLNKTIAHVKETWMKLEPKWPMTYSFVDQNFDAMYKEEQKLGWIISLFTGIGIFIACLGLYGLVKFNNRLRLKEIGIRKVVGASTNQVLYLILKKYVVLLTIASCLALPICVFTLNNWLSRFAYHVTIQPLVIVLSLASLILIALFTISFQSIKAALTNPVNVLKED